jgi:hypothetical protein
MTRMDANLNPLRQALDAEIRSLEESILESMGVLSTLRHRRNVLAPVSSLPTEVITPIFSFVRLSGTPQPGKKPDHLAWLYVSHVCHHWREIALDLPLFWSHVDFTNLTLAGAAEILARAKMAPLHLEARLPDTLALERRSVHRFRKRAAGPCQLYTPPQHWRRLYFSYSQDT